MPDPRPVNQRVRSSHEFVVAADAFLESGRQILADVEFRVTHEDLFVREGVALEDVQTQIVIQLFHEELARAYSIPVWVLFGYASREAYERHDPDKATGRDLDELAALARTRR